MALLLDWLLQPLGLAFAGLLTGLLLLLRQVSISRSALSCLVAGTGILWAASAPISANALVKRLETLDAQAIHACDAVQNDSPVVVLGAGIDAYVDSESPYEVLSQDTLSRTLHAATLEGGGHPFYLLGGGQTTRKLGDFMSRVLIDQGILKDRIVAETASLSTIENARAFAALVSPDAAGTIRLVTSRLHANRASATFRTQGFSVCTIAVDPLYSVSAGWIGYLPFLDALAKSTEAWRELLATWLYDWRGHTAPELSYPG